MNEMVAVTWTDAYFEREDSGGPQDEYLCTTLGYVIERDARFLRIASEQTPGGWRCITGIPVIAIENEYTLGRVP